MADAPAFDDAFRDKLHELFVWRRDVRRFRTDPLDPDLVEGLLKEAALAPSVGNSQPWRFVVVESPDRRARVRESFTFCNQDALAGYQGERAKLYAELKLEGLETAPVHLCAFCDPVTEAGFGLGSRTMPETLRYSVVGAIQHLWLTARARGIGMGWLSILDPIETERIMEVPNTWRLVAYLCLGYPEEQTTEPELVRAGWQDRLDPDTFIVRR